MTIVVTLLFSLYLLFDPANWLASLMQLTKVPLDFKIFLLLLVLGGFSGAWVVEKHFSVWVARVLGKASVSVWPQSGKKRKAYKTILEEMRI